LDTGFFLCIAWAFKLTFPKLDFREAYFCSQLIALIFAFTAMAFWVRRVVGTEWVGVGAALTALCLVPTFGYFTFYDIAIVGFYAICLLLLIGHQYGLYLIVFGLGLINHENLLLLLPVATLWLWDQRRKATAVWMGGGHLAVYLVYRLAIMHSLPNDTAFYSRVWQNSHPFIFYNLHPLQRSELVFSVTALFLPLAGAIIGYRTAPRILQIATIALLPSLFLVTFLFGQFHESRQFVAFIPVAVPMILCRLKVGRGEPFIMASYQ
jgi:hypothetical protein